MREYTGVILVREDGSVLSQLRDNNPKILEPNTWAIPGGTKEPDDPSSEFSAARELREETGYTATELHLFAEDDYINPRGEVVHRKFYWAPYDGKQKILCHEGQKMEFLHENELESLPVFRDHLGYLKMATTFRART